jgi:hypothetical protein
MAGPGVVSARRTKKRQATRRGNTITSNPTSIDKSDIIAIPGKSVTAFCLSDNNLQTML